MRLQRLWFVLLLPLLLWITSCGYTYRATVLEPPNAAAEIVLTDQFGQPFSLAEQRGKVVLLFFGFTRCPDICPTALSDLAAALRDIGAAAADVQVALVTVDPTRDTPDVLQPYLAAFDPGFLGLSGTVEQLEATYRNYGVTAIRRDLPDSQMAYTIDHSGYIYAIDRVGNWRLIWAHGTPVSDLTADIRALLRDPARDSR